MKKSLFLTVFIAIAISFALTGCYEGRYYRENHHHSPDYDDRHRGDDRR